MVIPCGSRPPETCPAVPVDLPVNPAEQASTHAPTRESRESRESLESRADVLIVGAGVAGLWTACRLAREGWGVVVLERSTIGGGQTIGSQGIIHGGIKYALTGQASRASAAIARMPEIWNACLRGDAAAEIDLRSVRVLSREQYLWTTPGVVSRLAGLGASKAIRTPVERVSPDDRPALFRAAPRGVAGVGGVDVYRVAEPVLDTHSTVASLVREARSRGVRFVQCANADLQWADANEHGSGVRYAKAGATAQQPVDAAPWSCIRTRAVILCAGECNESLARGLGLLDAPQTDHASRLMQLRPLHMVIARNARSIARDLEPMLFGHCLGSTTTPRITITAFEMPEAESALRSARAPDGASDDTSERGPRPCPIGWSIGGEIAESGVSRDQADQVRVARAELAACLPWLDTSKLELATIRWNRAEGLTADGSRPDEPVLRCFETQAGDERRGSSGGFGEDARAPVIVGWPTKLAFAPEFARRVSDELHALNLTPRGACEVAAGEVEPPLTPPLWRLEGLQWT